MTFSFEAISIAKNLTNIRKRYKVLQSEQTSIIHKNLLLLKTTKCCHDIKASNLRFKFSSLGSKLINLCSFLSAPS